MPNELPSLEPAEPTVSTPEFRLLSLNARSLLNKMDELRITVSELDFSPDIITVCETWCEPTEPDSLYSLDGYSVLRADRSHQGGGSLVYIRSELKHQLLFTTNLDGLESVWVEVTLLSGLSLIASSIYHPPNSPPLPFCTALEQSIKRACNVSEISPPHLILAGDFNAKHSSWYPPDQTDVTGENVEYLFNRYNLTQLVKFPTHILRGSPNSCLDLIATTMDPSLFSTACAAPIGNSDHFSVCCTAPSIGSTRTSPRTPPFKQQTPQWSWTPSRLQALKEDLAIHLKPFNEHWASGNAVEVLWKEWRGALLNSVERCCLKKPTTSPCKNVRSPYPARPWITADVVAEVRLKHRLHRRYLRDRSEANWCAFTQQRNLVTRVLRESKSKFVTNAESQEGYTPSNLYTVIRSLRQQSSRSIPDLQLNNEAFVTPSSKAEALNTFFISQSRQSVEGTSEEIPVISTPRVSECTVDHFSTTPESLLPILKQLDPRKSAGFDNIPTRVLKHAAEEIAPSLSHMFNASFQQASLPRDWKDATISPVYKKGDARMLTNYRPISLLSVVAKVQERVAYNCLSSHIDPHLPPHQSGFRSNDGTEYQLSRLVHQISEARDGGETVMSCFFDLSKAFDRVWHAGLLAKLHHFGVHGSAHAWLTAYLTGRRQRVKIDNSFSSWSTIPAGVPQGSVLGPLLFLIYTIDLPAACTNSNTICSQFADDTAMIATSKNFLHAESSLQEAVTSAGKWLQTWHLLVNASKTVIMLFHHANRPPERLPDITLHDVKLTVVPQHRHLGLIVQQNLTWDAHIQHVLTKCRCKLRQFHRLRSCLNANALCYLYKTYIRPVLEYASNAYSSISVKLSDSLERFQRKAARICLRLPLFSPVHHSSLLHQVGLPTLYSRRKLKLTLLAHSIHYQYAPPHILTVHPYYS